MTPTETDDLDEGLGQFFAARSKPFTRDTVRAYTTDIREFAKFVRRRNVDCLTHVSSDDAAAYVAHLRTARGRTGQPIRPGTVQRRFSCLSSYYRCLVRAGRCTANPFLGIPRPKYPARWTAHPPLPVADVERLLNAAHGEDFPTVRDRAILETLYGAGLSASELTRLNLADLDVSQEFVRVHRRGRPNLLPLGLVTRQALRQYVPMRAHVPHHRPAGDEPLFINRFGNRLSRRSVGKLFARYSRLAGIPKVTPLTLRNSLAHHLRDRGEKIQDVQWRLGHKHLETTLHLLASAVTTPA